MNLWILQRLWSGLLLMLQCNPRHTWHSAQSQFLPWPWGMLAGWQQPESRLIKNVTIVVTVRSSFSAERHCHTDSCCLEVKGYILHRLYSSTILKGSSGADLGSIFFINGDEEKSWKVKESPLTVFSARRGLCLHPWLSLTNDYVWHQRGSSTAGVTCLLLFWVNPSRNKTQSSFKSKPVMI